jgi:hypothetical protein
MNIDFQQLIIIFSVMASFSSFIMKITILSVLLCHFLAFSACSQTASTLYSDFVIAHDQLWALTGDGHFQLFDLKNAARLTEPSFEDLVVAIAADIHSTLVVGDKHHRIEKDDSGSRSWALPGNYSSAGRGWFSDECAKNGFLPRFQDDFLNPIKWNWAFARW